MVKSDISNIVIDGQYFYYSIGWDNSEAGEWEWTDFYLRTKRREYRKWWFFGPLLEEIIGDPASLVFTLDFSVKDKRYTKVEVRNAIEHAIELWKRPAEIDKGEII